MVACEHQFLNGKCNAFQLIAYLDFNRFPQNSVEADSDFCDIWYQIFRHFEADSTFSRSLSATLQQLNKMCSTFRMVACEHQCLKFDPFISCWDLHQCNGTCNAFRMIAYLEFNRFPQNSGEADLDFRDLQRQLFNNIISDSVFSDFQRQLFINIKANTFASLVCAPVTSSNQINRDKSSATFKLVVASVSNNNALSFNDKSSSTFKLVVASVTNEFSKGPTHASPAKQRPVSNDDLAFARSLQLHVPMTRASIWHLIFALTFKQSIKMQPIFQLIDVFVPNKNDSCSVFQMVAHRYNTFI